MSGLPQDLVENKIRVLNDLTKEIRTIRPFGNTVVNLPSGNDTIRYRLPREMLQGKELHLSASIRADGNVAGDDQLHSNVASSILRYRVRVGSTEASNINEYGMWKVQEDNAMMTTEERNSFGAICSGIPEKSASGTFKRYTWRLHRDSFLDRVLPLYKMPVVEIEIVFNNRIAEHLHGTQVPTTLDYQDFEMRVAVLRSDSLRDFYDNNVIDGSYVTYEHFKYDLPNASTSFQYVVPTSHRSLSGFYQLMRANATVTDGTLADKYQSQMLKNNLSEVFWTIDGEQHPSTPINTTDSSQIFTEYRAFFDMLKRNGENNHSGFMDSTYDGVKLVVAYDFSSHPDFVSGLDSNARNSQLVVNLRFASPGSSASTIDTFIKYDKLFRIGIDGSFSVSQ